MFHVLNALLLAAALVLTSGAPADARRVALVIGNGAYKAQGRLDNPANDARLVSEALAAVKFDVIDTRTDLGIADFRQVLRRFQTQADGAELALIYFAGHGIEANGANWLLPTDAELNGERDLEYEAIKTELLLQALQGARMRVLMLDACRANPFGRNWRASVRSLATGLAKIEADDVLVLFAAAPGRTASDGTGPNSPFALAVAKRLPEAGVPIQLLGGNIRDDVLATTGGAQRPYVSASITGQPYIMVPLPTTGNAAAKVVCDEACLGLLAGKFLEQLATPARSFRDRTFFDDQFRLSQRGLRPRDEQIAAIQRKTAPYQRIDCAIQPGSLRPATSRQGTTAVDFDSLCKFKNARGAIARPDVKVRFNMEATTENGPPRIVFLQTDQAGLFWERDSGGGTGGGGGKSR